MKTKEQVQRRLKSLEKLRQDTNFNEHDSYEDLHLATELRKVIDQLRWVLGTR
jgi:argininosuccinate lyase